MKKLVTLVAISFIFSILVFTGEAQAKIANMPFKGDQLSFVVNAKVVFPTTQPILVTKYANGSIRTKVFRYSSPIDIPFAYQATITYIFAPAARNRQGQVMSVVIQSLTDLATYNIVYNRKKVMAVTMTDNSERSMFYEYNSKNGTINSIVTRGSFNGTENILAEAVAYTYTYYNASKIRVATKTTTTYYTDPYDPSTFGEVMNTEVITETYDKRGNLTFVG
ncbi:MAG: hypothetical protein PHX20_00285 [Candidatus Omnitrophica bacterium]|nr:hypothetical protein [Candidatus Omnitrophota bacterium]MDD5435973.1 hypothetical protein [Candidatus Omnitrophota bacterium]